MSSLTDNYEIIRELGRGGMGKVYLANDKRLRRLVAIKVLTLNPTSEEHKIEVVNNFKREAVAIANLSHNNIVCVYDIGQQGDLHYIVMELIEGHPLSKLLKEEKHTLPIDTVLKIALEMCDALSYIHKNNVIHRDIKPENIIYTTKGISKLTDFGIAKYHNDDVPQIKAKPGTSMGSILYMSPEQLNDPDSVDGRADLYSFGVSMYQLLTGKLPFQGDTQREVITKILSKDPPLPPSKMETNLLPHFDPIILKAMEKDINKRFSSIDEFRDELNNVIEFKSKVTIQIGSNALSKQKEEKYYYSQIRIDSFDDLMSNIHILPEDAQQRFLYEIEILFHKYMDEYKNDLNDKKESGFIDSLKYVIPAMGANGMKAIKSLSVPLELITFLEKINGVNTIYEIIKNHYSIEQVGKIFNLIYTCAQKELISLKMSEYSKDNIKLHDILVDLNVITKKQLSFVVSESKIKEDSPHLGEMLIEFNYITRDKLLYILKLQNWYKRHFL